MIDSSDFNCVDELDEDFFLSFSNDFDTQADMLESSAADPDLWDDVPY